MKMQMEGQKMQADLQMKQADMQLKAQSMEMDRAQMEAELALKKMQQDAEISLAQNKAVAEIELKREIAIADIETKRMEAAMKVEATREAASKPTANIELNGLDGLIGGIVEMRENFSNLGNTLLSGHNSLAETIERLQEEVGEAKMAAKERPKYKGAKKDKTTGEWVFIQ
jgi:hypothetical protein